MPSIISQIITFAKQYLRKKTYAAKLKKQKYVVWKTCPLCHGKAIRQHKRHTWTCKLCSGAGVVKYPVRSENYPGARVDYEN